MSTEVKVAVIPTCDICRTQSAVVDGKTRMGPWAYMCEGCWALDGVGRLGTGYGQRLVLRETYRTGDSVEHATRAAALAHANEVARTTGQIIAVEEVDDDPPCGSADTSTGMPCGWPAGHRGAHQ